MSHVCVLCVKPLVKFLRSRVSLHVFPACPVKRQIWLNQCRLTNNQVLPNRKICSYHFEPSCFKSDAKRRILNQDAVPTIFVNSHVKTTNLPKIVKGRRTICNKKKIANIPLTRAAKRAITDSNCVSRDILPRKHNELDKPITKLKINKLSFMSLLQLVKIQISLVNGIK